MKLTIRKLFIVTALLAFLWSGYVGGKPHCEWRPHYKNVIGRGWAGGFQLFAQQGQQFHWHCYVDVLDAGDWKFRVVASSKPYW